MDAIPLDSVRISTRTPIRGVRKSMASSNQTDHHNIDLAHHIREADSLYSFNPKTGIFEPQASRSKGDPDLSNDRSERKYKREGAQSDRLNDAQKWMSIISGLVSCATLVLLYVTLQYARLQWKEMNDANKAAAKALEETKSANTSTSEDALRSYKLSRESVEDVQRAFVSPMVAPAYLVGQDGKTRAIQFSIRWENTGLTPTRYLTTHSNFQAIFGTLPDNFDFTDQWSGLESKVNQSTFLAPRQYLTASRPLIIPIAQLETITPPHTQKFVIWGWARYYDVFPNTRRHLSEYCYLVSGQREPITPTSTNQIGYFIENCDRHNCADQECNDSKSPTHSHR